MAAAEAASKEAEEAKAAGRNPVKVSAGGVEAGGALAPGQKGLLPMQTAGERARERGVGREGKDAERMRTPA